MAIQEVTKKLLNPIRAQKLRVAMEELNYLDRVINEMVRPIGERKKATVAVIKEALLDEGIPPDATQLRVDDDKMEATFQIEVADEEPPKTPSLDDARKKAAAKKKVAKKATKKKAAKKKAGRRR